MRKKIAWFLNWTGIVTMTALAILSIPFTLPRIWGYQLYGVESGSMEPDYAIDTVVYAKKTNPEEIKVGDVITYTLGSDTTKVMTHRVMEVDIENQAFITKGDANPVEDKEPVKFQRVLGKVQFGIRGIARISLFLGTMRGKIAIAAIFIIVLIMWLAADCLNKKAVKRKWSKSTVFLLVSGFFVMTISLILILQIMLDDKQADNTYERLRKEFITNTISEGPPKFADNAWEDIEDIENQENQEERLWYPQLKIEFDQLQKENPDIIGWIDFEQNAILDYPVLYSGDNEKYLRTDIYGKESTAGCIFMEAMNKPDFQDCHTILYGHNMRNGSMFGNLKKYKEPDFYRDNQYFTIYTRNVAYRYRIFACEEIPQDSPVYTVGFAPDETFQQFIDNIYKISYVFYEKAVTREDKIITLSTCSSGEKRFVVHGAEIASYQYAK